MRNLLFISAMAAMAFSAGAQDPEPEFDFDFELPEMQVIQICAVEEGTENPIPFASISIEYSDSILNETTDENGHLDFTPIEYPLTLTANCEGMQEVTYGLFEHPEETIIIVMPREAAKEQKELSASIE